MALAPKTRIGPYEIVAPLGAGGMGEVYRARDTRLDRAVAIKALPAAFASDPERLARFEREAKLLASLNHPNVGAIYGLEESGDQRFLVLEFVEGETLAARLASGALPIAEALGVAKQIAEALEIAHENGVIHRDLKPANVMVRGDGVVKVLDFGLAIGSAGGADRPSDALSHSPTLTRLTAASGVILGTAAYMSPEQARGKPVDRRTDIWSFGCLLYECLTGRQAFMGETVSDLVAKILEREPDWSVLPAAVPARVRRLLERCVRKDAKERLRDIGDARIELAEVLAGGAERETAPAGAAAAPRGRAWLPWAIAGLLAAALAVTGIGLVGRGAREPAGAVTRLSVILPVADPAAGDCGNYVLSPDGNALAIVLADSSGVPRVWVRPLDALESRPLPGTEGASYPFWSPDSRHVGFFAGGKLKRVPVSGGSAQTLCEANAGRGGAWSPEGVIVFAPNPASPLWKVEAGGGVPTEATVLDSARGEDSHRFPCFLPDGRHVIYGTQPEGAGNLSQICVAALGDPLGVPLLLSGSAPRYAEPGYLLFTRDQAILAQRIDTETLRMVGEPVPLAEQPQVTGRISVSPAVACSRDGKIAYNQADRRPTEISWVARDGRHIQTVLRHPSVLAGSSLSSGGDRLAASDFGEDTPPLWIFDLVRGTGSRVTAAGAAYVWPVWSPDGRRVACTVTRPGTNGVVEVDPESGAQRDAIPPGSTWAVPVSWTPDGSLLLVAELASGGQYDLRYLPIGDAGRVRTYLGTPATEDEGAISHDGRWIAYRSEASGRPEVYVDGFPEASRPVRVSNAGVGALQQVNIWWRRDDREIYFLGADGASMYACDARTSPSLEVGPPRRLFAYPEDVRSVMPAPDGERFLLLRAVGDRPAAITIVQNWARDLAKPD